ncbi:hypothetical protein GFB49_17500 [Epibacterium sp. SM1979]|uniref:Uncharacterized protein n=1 Tax=Tritonibacter litoralis TaxID=2662264 RepID=A0A843YGJ1_9RHOB|nr:hypothetical protein [Tritonibacter litoralis]MQQ10266.1 hypothetical protein [Tritonibacter litoralis]
MNDLEVIRFQPSRVHGSRSDNRLAFQWLARNAGNLKDKKVMFEGTGRKRGRSIHFALLRGMTEAEVQALYQQKKANSPKNRLFFWSYLPTDPDLPFPRLIDDCPDTFDRNYLDCVLGGVGEVKLWEDILFPASLELET